MKMICYLIFVSLALIACQNSGPKASAPESITSTSSDLKKKFQVDPAYRWATEFYTLKTRPAISAMPSGEEIYSGGFSGLFLLRQNSDKSLRLITHTDRGPNGEVYTDPVTGDKLRPFAQPTFQPRWIDLSTDPETKTLWIRTQTFLTTPSGRFLSGLPNSESKDERPMSLTAKAVPFDPLGIDPEGITIDHKGTVWMVEEYRPSILKFDDSGKLLKRFVPQNSLTSEEVKMWNSLAGEGTLSATLPEILNNRAKNRGFEGVATLGKFIYAALQSPLPNEKDFLIIEMDLRTEKITRILKYPMTDEKVDKIGDLAAWNKGLVVLEQEGKIGKDSVHHLFHVTIPSKGDQLTKVGIADLSGLGFDNAEKLEGLAAIDENTLAVINDDDFGLTPNLDIEKGRIALTKERPVRLMILRRLPITGEKSSP
ncbi:MAG: esterase-like activity of phytase family protein [Proteobacteria bacterium]|jgi:3-phytase|nr:esterase-like activity of phytase family protein [Pseudomonadota bacterium]